MTVSIKDKKLHSKVMKRINYFNSLELKAINRGNLTKAREYEKKSDNLYKDNYYKMFQIKKN
jgi:hypothetical protein